MTNIQEHFYKTELETILLPTSSKGNFMVTDQNIKIVNKTPHLQYIQHHAETNANSKTILE